MSFNYAQTFVLDPSNVNGASQVLVTRVQLFFRAKPGALKNRSGIRNPGVRAFLVPTENGKPLVSRLGFCPFARADYHDVRPSADASVATEFVFNDPVGCRTSRAYAVVLAFDGDEQFELWTSDKGQKLVGSAAVSTGPSKGFRGEFFEYVNAPAAAAAAASSTPLSATPSTQATETFNDRSWRALPLRSLKLNVMAARFAVSGSANLASVLNPSLPVQSTVVQAPSSVTRDGESGGWNYRVSAERFEYVSFDYSASAFSTFVRGERAWQHTCFYPNSKSPAALSVAAGSTLATSTANLAALYSLSQASPEYMVAFSGTSCCVRRVLSLPSNTSVQVDQPFPWTNSAATFYRPPVGMVELIQRTRLDGKRGDLLYLTGSNGNSSVRFVNGTIQSMSATVGGAGYSNTDVITVTGFESVAGVVTGGYPARAVISTNSTGGIVQVFMQNTGAGFLGPDQFTATVANATGGATSGTGALFAANVGVTVASEFSFVPGVSGYVSGGSIVNPQVHDSALITPLNGPPGTFVQGSLSLPYYRVRNQSVAGGWAYHLDLTADENDSFVVTPGMAAAPSMSKIRVLPSWSNEQVITRKEDGTQSNGAGGPPSVSDSTFYMKSNSAVLTIRTTSNNDWVAVSPPRSMLGFSRYLINNSYAGEHTNYGNASSKAVHRKVTLKEGSYAEDLRVDVRAWKPANTDIQVYAKIHNDNDIDAFDDKDWTRMNLTSAARKSDVTNEDDLVDMSFGFQQWPNTSVTLAGTVETTSSSTTILGQGTAFDASLQPGVLIRIYNPLFPATSYMVNVVDSVPAADQLVVHRPVTDPNVLGPGMMVDVMGFPHQAFNNMPNDNVVRYYATNMSEFDAFSTYQIKVVFLADSENVVPKLDSLTAVAISS